MRNGRLKTLDGVGTRMSSNITITNTNNPGMGFLSAFVHIVKFGIVGRASPSFDQPHKLLTVMQGTNLTPTGTVGVGV